MLPKTKFNIFFKSNLFFVILFFCFSLFFSLLKLSKGYTFEWDQSDDASKVFSIISQKKPLLIGPRVSNDNGFFVGPYHYYYLLPFYLLTKGDPIAGAYAVVFINILTTIISFFLIRKISNTKIAFISSLIISLSLGKICWSAMYAPLIAIIAFYICYQAINHKFYFPTACLFAGFVSNLHLVPASLIPIIIFSFFLSKNKANRKEILIGLLFFCLPFLPLIIFDLRHNFLNFNKFIMMLSGTDNVGYITNKYIWLRSFWRSLNIFNIFPLIAERLFFLVVLFSSPFVFKGKNNKILILIWILFPILILSQYSGAISEYYYGMVTSLIPFFLTLILFKIIKNKLILSLIISSILFLSIRNLVISKSASVTLNDKKNIVNYLINQKQDQPFNLSYETGIGLDFGFNYLFEYQGKLPENTNDAHLYTLFTDDYLPTNSNIVLKQSIYSLVRR
jgi:hypothetical protein